VQEPVLIEEGLALELMAGSYRGSYREHIDENLAFDTIALRLRFYWTCEIDRR